METRTSDRVYQRLEEEALGALDDYRAFRTYQGDNPVYFKRARIGVVVLSTYGRVRGTRANERALSLMERRASSEMSLPAPSTLAALPTHADKGVQEPAGTVPRTAQQGGARTAPRK